MAIIISYLQPSAIYYPSYHPSQMMVLWYYYCYDYSQLQSVVVSRSQYRQRIAFTGLRTTIKVNHEDKNLKINHSLAKIRIIPSQNIHVVINSTVHTSVPAISLD